MKWVMVTGDSRGLGRAIVQTLLAKPCYGVVGLSRTRGKAVTQWEEEYKDRYVHFNFDLSAIDEVKPFYREHIKNVWQIYGFVNNAAYAYDDIISNLNRPELEKMYLINVFTPMMFTKYVIRDMLLHNTAGSIVHISSVSAHTGYKGLSFYGSTKAALESFSRAAAREWGEKGIRSNCVAPGFMDTAMSAALTPEQRLSVYKRTALKKAVELQSAAETVEFLLSDKASSITGTTVHVDCGGS